MKDEIGTLTSAVQAASDAPPVSAFESQGGNGSQRYTRAEFQFMDTPDSSRAEPDLKSN